MSCYIIGIGGTGHRVINSLIPLAAAGLIDAERVNILMVDAEDGNGNYMQTEENIRNYMTIKEMMGKSQKLFRTELLPVLYDAKNSFSGYLKWSPMSVEDSSGKKSDSRDFYLRNLFSYDYFSDTTKRLMNFFYTGTELEQSLEKGFYGHPSIGSAIMARSINDKDETWSRLIENIKGEVANGDVKVLLVGSIFGGTGASGLPVISEILHEKISSNQMKLGGILLLPYFKLKKQDSFEEEGFKPDCEKFMSKSKSALLYYNSQHYLDKLDRIYILGDDYEEMLEEDYNSGGPKQKNKANIVELYSALAAVHFFNTSGKVKNNDKAKVLYLTTRLRSNEQGKSSENVPKYVYNWNAMRKLLHPEDAVRNNLAQLMRFAVAYSKTYYHGIHFVMNDKRDYRAATWYRNFFGETEKREESTRKLDNYSKVINNFCNNLIEYFRQIHIEKCMYDGDYNLASNINLFNFSYRDLFDMSYDSNINIKNYEKLVFGFESRKNKSGIIYASMCDLKYANFKIKRFHPFPDFIEALFGQCELINI